MYKGAVIGLGNIARAHHLAAFNNSVLNTRAKIVAAVEPVKYNREKGQEDYPGMRMYSSTEELFENENIDFADITAPPRYHYEILQKCIEHNVNIICEKPFTLSSSRALEIKEKLEKTNLVFIPCHQYKYSPLWKIFKCFIDENSDSPGFILRFDVLRTGADRGLPAISNQFRTGRRDEGGGIISDTGVHYLYLAEWMLGKADSVTADIAAISHSDYNCEDTAFILFKNKKGIAQIFITWSSDTRQNSASVISCNSSLFYSGDKLIKTRAAYAEELNIPDASDKQHYTGLYIQLFSDFLTALDEKENRSEWIEDAYSSVCLVGKCYGEYI
jgi:predicted dehydrogenase